MAKTLREFLRERPDREEVRSIIAEIDEDGPRGTAILASVLVENFLKNAIACRLPALDEKELDELTEGSGPLATFSSRIQIGYGLGIYGKKTRHDLNSVRTIRNAFAHARRAITFDTPAIAALCSGFHSAKDISDRQEHSTRTIYVSCCKLLLMHLSTRIAALPGEQPSTLDGITELD